MAEEANNDFKSGVGEAAFAPKDAYATDQQ